jgi:DNA-binding MarR family transcriptional regulator
MTRKSRSANDDALADLYGRPAFMIRRAHQIATSIFTSSCAELGLTPSQFSLMFVLRHRGPVGQNELGRLVSLDRSTTALVVRGLRARELVDTSPDPSDRRKMIVRLTDKGRLLLSRAEKLSTKASDKLLSAFDPHQASAFLSLLETLTSSLSAEAVNARPGAGHSSPARRTRV